LVTDLVTLDELADSAMEWAEENLDQDVLASLSQIDREKVRQALADLQKKLGGAYVLDLAPFKDTAKSLVPLLRSYEETTPYAAWLRSRLDYFDVAEELKRASPVPKQPQEKPVPTPIPSPKAEREIWMKQISKTSWPEAAKPLIPKLKPIFKQAHVPVELVWIAEVESSFDPHAKSPAGAAGLFQLMPATAKRFGLRRWPFDQRYTVEPSARAAAQYMAILHSRFKDWRLALAAYNAGEGTVQRLLSSRKARGFDEISGSLPAETQMYVPKIEAVIERREGLRLDQLRSGEG